MEKIVILSFLFLACVVLESQSTTTVVGPDMTPNTTVAMPMMSSSSAPGDDNRTSTAPTAPATTTPTSGVVNVKALAGFVFSFALIALF